MITYLTCEPDRLNRTENQELSNLGKTIKINFVKFVCTELVIVEQIWTLLIVTGL